MLFLLSCYYIGAELTISAGLDILVVDRGGKTMNFLFTALLLLFEKVHHTNALDRGNGVRN